MLLSNELASVMSSDFFEDQTDGENIISFVAAN